MSIVKNLEKIFEENPERYYELHAKATEKGIQIKNGARVKPTRWCVQNGVHTDGTKGTKTGDGKTDGTIRILVDGKKRASSYWAGFWEKV